MSHQHHVAPVHAVPMLYAVNKTEQDLVSAYRNTLEILMKDVVRNVYWTQIARRIGLVSETNVMIRAQAHADKIQIVKWLIICRHARAALDSLEILTGSVKFSKMTVRTLVIIDWVY